MKNTYRKGQAATEFLMTYGWAILAIVIVAAVLWNMGIFKSSCTTTAPVQIFPAGSQLSVKDWSIQPGNILNMTIQNLAGSSITVTNASFNDDGGTGYLGSTVQIGAGNTNVVQVTGGVGTITPGTCFTSASVVLNYTVSGGQPHSVTGSLQGKYP